MYSKIKHMSNKKYKPANTGLKSKGGNIVMEQQAVLIRWTEYIGELFNDNESLNVTTDIEMSGDSILEAEVEAALKDMKFEKVPGNDNITTELITACQELDAKKVCSLVNKIYETGVIPKANERISVHSNS